MKNKDIFDLDYIRKIEKEGQEFRFLPNDNNIKIMDYSSMMEPKKYTSEEKDLLKRVTCDMSKMMDKYDL